MRRLAFALSIFVLFGWLLGRANAQTISLAGNNPLGLTLCPPGPYALCESSICTPTGGTILVNVAGPGLMAPFPEASCTCPIKHGIAIADVTGGNMTGTCAPPGPNQVWSLYNPKSELPQEVNNWSRKPSQAAVKMQLCPSSLGLGNKFANCFSFKCTVDKERTNGVKTATCLCPLGENPDGSAAGAETAFITPAGQCNTDVCAQYPVGAAFKEGNGQPSQCLNDISPSDATHDQVPAE